MNLFDITEDELNFRAQVDTNLAHVLGSKTEQLRFLPDLSRTAATWHYLENDEKLEHLATDHNISRARVQNKIGENDFSQTYSDKLDDIHAESENKAFYDRMGPNGPGSKVKPHTHSSKTAQTKPWMYAACATGNHAACTAIHGDRFNACQCPSRKHKDEWDVRGKPTGGDANAKNRKETRAKTAVERKQPRLEEYACPNGDCRAHAEPIWTGAAANCVVCGSEPELLTDPIQKDARRSFSEMEKNALIEEEGAASNAHRIDVKGTHYESQSAAEIAMAIMPLKGL